MTTENPGNTGIPPTSNRITIRALQSKKESGEIIAALSIYDAPHAGLFEKAGGDIIIVGDSAAMAVQGKPNTLPMTMEEMLIFASAVCRGTKKLFVVGDMPLGSYEISNEAAVKNALRFMKGVGDRTCNAVKVETNMAYIERIRAIAHACLVVAHIGLNPNKAEMLGGYRTQGKTRESMKELTEVAVAAEDAGACMLLMESVTEEVAQTVKEEVGIPVIGIAAGRKLHGQLVISNDLLGLYEWPGNAPKHFERYRTDKAGLTIGEATAAAFDWYVKAVKAGEFPSDKHVHHLSEREIVEIMAPPLAAAQPVAFPLAAISDRAEPPRWQACESQRNESR